MTVKKHENPQETRTKIVEAALALAAEQGWEYTTLRDISARSQVDFPHLREEIDDKGDILVILGRMIDRKVFENMSKIDEESPVRDRIFDLMMERYDVLNDYRAGVVAIVESFKYDPKQAVISLPHVCKSMAWMLEAAGIETAGVKGAMKVAGLSVIYLKVLRVWAQDESADLPKTMAALDKALGKAETWAETLGF